MISIIIPLYNKRDTIRRSVKSVLSQTFNDFELIIVDDGSSDDSLSMISDIKDDRIFIVSQQNRGVSSARNRGVSISRGDYVAFLDADDEWDNDYLECQKKMILSYPKCNVFGTNYRFKNREGVISHTVLNNVKFIEETGILDNYFEVASCSHVPVWTSAVIIKKEALISIGGFPANIKSGEDLLTWARLIVSGTVAYCKTPKATYNLGEGYDYSNLPPRRQDPGDPVGVGLKELYKFTPEFVGLRKYISHWHKMRASVAIRYGEKMETIVESCKSLYYNPLNYKVLPFIILSLIPVEIRKKIIVKFKG